MTPQTTCRHKFSQSFSGMPATRQSSTVVSLLRTATTSPYLISQMRKRLTARPLVGRSAAEGRVGSIGVIEADPTSDPSSCLTASLECIEEDAFIFQRSPQPLDEDIVHPAATAVHRDANVGIPQSVRERKARELRALIRVEDLGLAEAGDCLL